MSTIRVYRGPRDVPYIKVTARICGDGEIETWRALMALDSLQSDELAGQILAEALQAARENPQVLALMRGIRRDSRNLHILKGDPSDAPRPLHPLRGRRVEEPGALSGPQAAPGLPPG